MNRNKQILNYCPNYYKVINFDYFEEDTLTASLINIYRDFIFNIDIANLEDIKTAHMIDEILAKYIDDYTFRKEMKYELLRVRIKKSCDNILRALVDSIINIFYRYQEGTTRKIYISRWI